MWNNSMLRYICVCCTWSHADKLRLTILQAIDRNHRGNSDDCFREVLLTWLQSQPEPGITDLLTALRSTTVDRNDVAGELESAIDEATW